MIAYQYNDKDDLKNQFAQNGFIIIKDFYPKALIEELAYTIYKLIGLQAKNFGIEIQRQSFSMDTFDDGYHEIIKKEPKIHSIIYDSLKNIPAFIQIVSYSKKVELFKYLMDTSIVGVGHKSYGMRIDKPNDEIYRTDWHQDFHTHARSKRGVVFWAPLTPISAEMGYLQLLKGSHKEGPLNLSMPQLSDLKDYEYSRIANSAKIENIEKLFKTYPLQEATLNKGDLLVFDYMLVHRSGLNLSNRSRWTIQIRYFDFEDQWGVDIGWSGTINSGKRYEDLFPELIKTRETN